MTMSDHPSSPASDPINGLKPLSPSEHFSRPATADDLFRLGNRADLSTQGLTIDEIEDEDDDDDEEAEADYVAVDHEDTSEFPYWFRRAPIHQPTKLDELHPFTQVLTVSHVDDCVEVEKAFPEAERCSRDKFVYRLNRCPELCLGLFTIPLVPEGQPKPRPTLVGHVIGTRTSTPLVTDRAMQLPANWKTERFAVEDGQTIGHDEYGTTIAIHSLAVLPEHQGKGVGSTLMKSYIQRIKEAQIAERIAMIAHEELVPFYDGFGFQNRGKSQCQFAGGDWTDLVMEFDSD